MWPRFAKVVPYTNCTMFDIIARLMEKVIVSERDFEADVASKPRSPISSTCQAQFPITARIDSDAWQSVAQIPRKPTAGFLTSSDGSSLYGMARRRVD